MHAALVALFSDHFGEEPTVVKPLAGDGSQRRYLRLVHQDGRSAIGAIGLDTDENRAFLAIQASLAKSGVNVPGVFAVHKSGRAYLLQDLGDLTLFRELQRLRIQDPGSPFPAAVLPRYEQALDLLVPMQLEAARTVDFSKSYPREAFDRLSMQWDLNYFKYCFLKLAHVPFHEARLEASFVALLDRLSSVSSEYFLHRDFQSRNLMIHDDTLWTIDFQGGRRGPLHYDVASLLFDGKAAMPPETRKQLLASYVRRVRKVSASLAEDVEARFYDFVLLRILQAMGAYGYLGIHQRKPHFVLSIPHAAENLRWLREHTQALEGLPELERVVNSIGLRWPKRGTVKRRPGLNVRVVSFSFRVGAPYDPDGHGGGHAFDCRAIENPGRHESMQTMTGLDDDVKLFLEQRADVSAWFANVRALCDHHIQEYQRRGFTSLTLQFGCTGGQHRSVYFAERLARELRETYADLPVIVEHAERERWPAR